MIKAKKSLGQHFLNDEHIALKIVSALTEVNTSSIILEIGPGMGVLLKYLIQYPVNLYAVENDKRMISYLAEKFPSLKSKLIHEDFLKFDLIKLRADSPPAGQAGISIIGNFPYNISTQILFKAFENRNIIPLIVGMFQKEVAQRIAARHGNKEYGVPTVLLQAFYDVDYLFEVSEECFSPPPKVKSAVIRLRRKREPPNLKDEKFFACIVKAGFGQRRKTLRNSLKSIIHEPGLLRDEVFSKRAEQLSVQEWINLANLLSTPR